LKILIEQMREQIQNIE
ncbi:MAG TPA: hypothetical protein DEP05_06855, partial [Betaproteobacteria bacterium]|nr:hypothetical protein [Betaproteobacteria bacterium]